MHWVYGKVKSVTRTPGCTTEGTAMPDLEFHYDVTGNMVEKIVKIISKLIGNLDYTTYYVHDASGNIMATYEKEGSAFKLTEQQLYGSSHIGTEKRNLDLITPPVASNITTRILGKKQFFLSDHRGNNNVTVLDRKTPIETTLGSGIIAYYEPVIDRAVDFYPFGREMNGRFWHNERSEFGYNGKQNIKEWSARLGGAVNYGDRIKIDVLFITPDPLFYKYPDWSPYIALGDNPIFFLDPDGKVLRDANGNIIYTQHDSKDAFTYVQGNYEITVTPVYVFANTGERIEVQRYSTTNTISKKEVDSKVITESYNCHGYSSLSSEFRVGSSKEESNKLLLDKGGFGLNEDLQGVVNKNFNGIKKGDVVVLFNRDGVAVHSFLYEGDDINENKVTSKNGEYGINVFQDPQGGLIQKPNATIQDVVDLYNQSEEGGVTSGFFTPVDDRVAQDVFATPKGDKTSETYNFQRDLIKNTEKFSEPVSTKKEIIIQ